MKSSQTLFSLLAWTHLVSSLPAHEISTQATPYAIKDVCTNLRILTKPTDWGGLDPAWIAAECLVSPNSTERVSSGVYLATKLANNGPTLTWKAGGDLRLGTRYCQITGPSELTCECFEDLYHRRKCQIDLDSGISVYNGHLLSNVSGTPDPPQTTSNLPFPANPEYHLDGNTTCPYSDTDDPCRRPDYQCKYSPITIPNAWWNLYEPLTCFKPRIYFEELYTFNVFQFASEAAWEVTVFADEECKTPPMAVIGSNDFGKCLPFHPVARAFTIRSLFNTN